MKGASSKHQPNESEVLANINTFAISRLVETALVNISRIEVIWKILVSIIGKILYRLLILIYSLIARYKL